MSEDEWVDILDLILESIDLVRERFAKISDSDDFVSTPDGVTLLDAIAMRLQVIGESVKRLQKKSPSLYNNKNKTVSSVKSVAKPPFASSRFSYQQSHRVI